MVRPAVQRLVLVLIAMLIHAAWFSVLAVCFGEGHEAHALLTQEQCSDLHEVHHGGGTAEDLCPCPGGCGSGSDCVDLLLELSFLSPAPPLSPNSQTVAVIQTSPTFPSGIRAASGASPSGSLWLSQPGTIARSCRLLI